MSDKPQNKAKSTDRFEDKALDKPSTNPELARESQTDAKGQQVIEHKRSNKHDGSAGKSDQGDIESVRIESIDEHGNKKVASRKEGGSEQDLLPAERPTERFTDQSSDRPVGGFDEIHRVDGGITLKGVIPGPGEELANITTGTMEALAPENALVKNALEMRRQLDQHMEPGAEKDKLVRQLKADVTASLMSGDIGESELAGTHKALSLESGQNSDTNRDVAEKPHESPRVSPERMQAVESATAFLVAETARLHGRDKVAALGIEKSDVGRALGTYLLTPDVAKAVGEADTRKFGQILMVFGLAPAFGLGDEAQKQISERTQETIHEGSANFLTGTAFGAILEGHSAVALSIGAVMTATFLQDQLFSPENRARNEEVLDLYSKTGNSSPEELLSFCDRSKELLGPEAYKASFDLATGGIGIPHGHAAARGIKADGGKFDIGAMTKSAAERLKQLPHEAMRFINDIVGHEPILQPADGPPLNRHFPITPEKNENSLFMTGADNLEGKGPKRGKSHIEGELVEGVHYQIDKDTGRLKRTDLGEPREPYRWPVINERMSHDVIRQSEKDSCFSAVGEMLSNGKLKEKQFIESIGNPSNTELLSDELSKTLGEDWTWKSRSFSSFAEISENGPWAAVMYEYPWVPRNRGANDPHVVVIDGVKSTGNLSILDPYEGTRYEMTETDFKAAWTGQAVYRLKD